jgi:hypothetical protein
MYLYQRIATESQLVFRAGLPARWAEDPLLGQFTRHRELIQEIRSASELADRLTIAWCGTGVQRHPCSSFRPQLR